MPAALPLIAALVLAASPVQYGPTERVDLIETNFYYDENGRPLLTQLLFCDWNEREARYDIREWRLAKSVAMHPKELPDGTYSCCWTEGGEPRIVYATKHRTTYTQHDPELIQRKRLAREDRIPLFKERQPTPALPPAIQNWIEPRNDPLPPALEGMP